MSEYPTLRKIWDWGMVGVWWLATIVIIQDRGLTLASCLWLLAALLIFPPIKWRIQALLSDIGPKTDA
jgi:hypothetical protein